MAKKKLNFSKDKHKKEQLSDEEEEEVEDSSEEDQNSQEQDSEEQEEQKDLVRKKSISKKFKKLFDKAISKKKNKKRKQQKLQNMSQIKKKRKQQEQSESSQNSQESSESMSEFEEQEENNSSLSDQSHNKLLPHQRIKNEDITQNTEQMLSDRYILQQILSQLTILRQHICREAPNRDQPHDPTALAVKKEVSQIHEYKRTTVETAKQPPKPEIKAEEDERKLKPKKKRSDRETEGCRIVIQ